MDNDFQALHTQKNRRALTGMSQEILSSSSEKLVKTENNEMTDFKSNIRTPRKSNIQVLPTLKAAAQWLKAQEDQVVKLQMESRARAQWVQIRTF